MTLVTLTFPMSVRANRESLLKQYYFHIVHSYQFKMALPSVIENKQVETENVTIVKTKF